MLKQTKETVVYCKNCSKEGHLPDLGWITVMHPKTRRSGYLCPVCANEYWTLKEEELQNEIKHNSPEERGDFWDD